MEKRNKTKSALKKTTNIFRRNTKSRLAIQKFLNDLQEQESEYLNENNQITQCVFLGALCLKPVPDIFQVTLQPVSFTTNSKTSILYNNSVKTVNNNVTERDSVLESEDNTSKVKVNKNPRKNSKTSAIEAKVFIGNICEPKPRNRILELFNDRTLSTKNKVQDKSSKVKLNEKNKKDKKIKYKIKVSGILNRNKKDFNNQKEKEVPQKTDIQIEQVSRKLKNISEKISMAKIPKNKPSQKNKVVKPETREVKNCEIQIKDSNYKVNNTISLLKVKKCKSNSEIKKSNVDNAIERLKKNRGIEVKKVTKMETKLRSIPSLVPVQSLVSECDASWEFENKAQLGQVNSVIRDSCNQSEQGTSNLKEGSVELLEIVDDEIEDYLEIDQNIVADLEALIPEEEIESISNTLISSTEKPNTFFSHCDNSESKPFENVTANLPLNETKSDLKKCDEIILVNNGKSREEIDVEDNQKDVEMKNVSISDGLDNNVIEKNNILDNVSQKMINNEQSEEGTKVSKRKSGDILLISQKQKVFENLEEPQKNKHNKRRKLMQPSLQKIDMKLNKNFKVKSKLEISKNIRKITDFLFPVEETDKNFRDKSSHKKSTESLIETRTLRSCSKQCQSREDVHGPELISESKVAFICKNDMALQSEKISAPESEVGTINENNSVQENESTVTKKSEQISSASIETERSISTLSIEKLTSAAHRSQKEGILLDKYVSSDCEISIPVSPDQNKRIQISENIHNQSELTAVEIRNSKRKQFEEKKQSIEIKKINKSIIEKDKSKKISSVGEYQIDSKLKIIDIGEPPKIAQEQFDSNEQDLAEIPTLNIHKRPLEPIVEEVKPVYCKLENSYKQSENEVMNEEPPNLQKSVQLEPLKVISCSETAAGVEKQVESIIKSNNLIEPKTDVKIVEKQHDSTEHNIKLNESISKIQLRSKIQKGLISEIKEAKVDNHITAVDPDKKEIAPIRKSKRNTYASDYPNASTHQSNKVPDKNNPKIKEICKVLTENQRDEQNSDLESGDLNELGKTNSLNQVTNKFQKKRIPCEGKEVETIEEHNGKSLKIETSQETGLDISKTRFQLRKKIVDEISNGKSETKKPIHLGKQNRTKLIDNETLNKPKFRNKKLMESMNQSQLLISDIASGGVGKNNLMLPDARGNAVKNNVFRNTRRNKIENETSSIIPRTKSNKKRHSTKIELNLIKKEDIKELGEQEVKKNKETVDNETTSLKKKNKSQLKAIKLKILNTKNQIKSKNVLKKLIHLKSSSRKKMIEKGDSIIVSSKSKKAENKTKISNKKKNDVIESLTPEIQNTDEVKTNTKQLLGKISPILNDFCTENMIELAHKGNLINNQLSSVNEIELSDPKDGYSEIELLTGNSNEVGKADTKDKKYTFRNRRNNIVERKTISSEIHNVADAVRHPKKNISKTEYSPNTLLENFSKTKSNYKHQLKENKTEVNSTKAFAETFIEVDVSEEQRENISQDCLSESVSRKKINGEDEINVTLNVLSTQNIPSLNQENITELESATVETANSKNITKKALHKSLTVKVQKDGTQLRQKNILEMFSVDSSLDMLSKKKEIIEATKKDEALTTGKQLKNQQDDTSQKFNNEMKITNHEEECRISEKICEEKKEYNVAVDVASSNAKSSSEQNISTEIEKCNPEKNFSRNAKRKKEHVKSSVSQARKVAGEASTEHADICKNDFQRNSKETQINSLDNSLCENQFVKQNDKGDSQDLVMKTRRRHEAPIPNVQNYIGSQLEKKKVRKTESSTNITLDVVPETKPRKKPSKRVGIEPTNADGRLDSDQGKLKVQNKIGVETLNRTDVEIDIISSQVIVFSDQKILSVETGNVEVGSDNSKIKKSNTKQVEPPVLKDFEQPNSYTDSEKTEMWRSQRKLDITYPTNIKEEQLQMTSEIEATTLDIISDKTELMQETEEYDSISSVLNTRNLKESEDIGQVITLKGMSNEMRNIEEISTEKPLFNDLEQEVSTAQSSSVAKTDEVDLAEPKKRRYRKADPQDQTTKNRQATRKKKNDGMTKLANGDKANTEDNYTIPYLLKEDLSNPNSELSQEIERQMQMEFSREFPNYGSSTPEPYRRIYRCRICLLVCQTYGRLKLHRRIHDVPTPYQCQQCDKSFDDVEDLAAHLRIHRGKMPYPCKKCDSSFWTSMQLERHQLVHVLKKLVPSNSNAPKKVFKCEVCLKEFKKICDLERHTRVHTGEKPSVCNICNKRFQQAYNLHKHLLTHTQEKNYECVICQKRFGRSDVLNRHVLTHSIDKPYHCSICLKTFIRNSQLKLHLTKHHGMSAEEADVAAVEKESDSTPPINSQEESSATPAIIQDEEPVAGTSAGLTEHKQVCAF